MESNTTPQAQQPKKRNWWKWGLLFVLGGGVLLVGGCAVLIGAAILTTGGGDQGIEQAGGGFEPDKRCVMDRSCDLGPGKVTVTHATATDFINLSYDKPLRSTGNFVIVEYSYISDRNQPVSPVYESPFVLVDSEGRTYNEDSDATGAVAIDHDVPIGGMDANDIQPGTPVEGITIFDVPTKDARGFTLRLVDPVEPQVGDTAALDLEVTRGQFRAPQGG